MSEIVDIYAQAGVLLTQSGDRWSAPCPFHSEKKPSFMVYGDGGYHCFGCGAHGTLQDIAEYAGVEFFNISDLAYERDHTESELFFYLKSVEEGLQEYTRDIPYKSAKVLYDKFDDVYSDIQNMAKDVECSLVSAIMHLRVVFKDSLYENTSGGTV